MEKSYELEAHAAGGSESPARDRNIQLLTLWGCLVVTGQYTILAFLALDLHRSAGLSLASASLLVALANGCGILGRVFWGAISDHALGRGRKPLLLLLNGVGLVAAVALLATPRSAPVAVFAALAALAGFALIGYQGLWVTLVAEMAGPRRVGAATGFAVTFVQLAIALGEAGFRDREAAVLAEVCRLTNHVVATGGGCGKDGTVTETAGGAGSDGSVAVGRVGVGSVGVGTVAAGIDGSEAGATGSAGAGVSTGCAGGA